MCPTRLEILMECPGLVKPDGALVDDVRVYVLQHNTQDNFLNIKRILKALKGESSPNLEADPPDLRRIIYAALLLALPPQDSTQTEIRKERVRVLYEEILNHLTRLREARGITEKSIDIYLNFHGICVTLVLLFLLSTFLYTGFTHLDLIRRHKMKKRFMQKLAEFQTRLATNPIAKGDREPARRAFVALCTAVAPGENIPFLAHAQGALTKPLLYLHQIYKNPEIIHLPTLFIPSLLHRLVVSMCSSNRERASLFLHHLVNPDIESHITSVWIERTNSGVIKFKSYNPIRGLGKFVVYSKDLDNDKSKITDQLVELITKPLAKHKFLTTTVYVLNPEVNNPVLQPPLLTSSYFPNLPLFMPPPPQLMEPFIFLSLSSILRDTTSDTNDISQHIEALIDLHPTIVNLVYYKRTLAHICSEYNHTIAMQIFIRRDLDVNIRNGYGVPLLYRATEYQRAEIVDILLKAHANIDQPNQNGFTSLYCASMTGNLQITTLLLDSGASVNIRCSGFYPLHAAASIGHTEIVRLLLQHGADVDQLSDNRFTPLSSAIDANKPDVVRVLLQHEASLTIRCGFLKETPLERAKGKRKIMDIIKQHKIFEGRGDFT